MFTLSTAIDDMVAYTKLTGVYEEVSLAYICSASGQKTRRGQVIKNNLYKRKFNFFFSQNM